MARCSIQCLLEVAGQGANVDRPTPDEVLNHADAIQTIQRNAHVYGELRDWPSWQLYTKVCYGEPLMFRSLTED